MAAEAHSELELLERVFLRLASADSDEQLEKCVATFLTPVLLKLASPHEEVKKKVMEVLTHINKRVKSRPKIQLPIEAVLVQYQDPSIPLFVMSFSILYLRTGFPRLPLSAQVELIPTLIKCMNNKPAPQQDCLLQLLTPILQHVKIPDDPLKRNNLLGVTENTTVSKLFLDFTLDVLLLPYGSTEAATPPGLSTAAVKRVTGDTKMDPTQLEQTKLGIIKFLAADVFPASDVICHFLVATADTRHGVSDRAEHELKRMVTNTDWENAGVVSKMFSIFQGTVATPKAPQVPTELKRSPANIRLKQRIYPCLLKSRKATSHFPACLQVVFDSLFGASTNAKLRIYAVQFVHHVAQCTEDKFMTPMGPVLFSGMTKLINEEKEDQQLRGLAYVAVGKLAKRMPQLVSKDVAMAQRLFNAVCNEDPSTRISVQEALSMMAPAYKGIQEPNNSLMEALLLSSVEQQSPQARLVAVQYANGVFPTNHVPSRYICILASADEKEDVKEEAKKGLQKTKIPTESYDAKEVANSLPLFPEIVLYVHQKANERLNSSLKFVSLGVGLPFNPKVFLELLTYIRDCLHFSAGVTYEDDINNQTLRPISVYIEKLVSTENGKQCIDQFVSLLKQALNPVTGSDLHAVAMNCLLQITAGSKHIASTFHTQLDWIKNYVFSSQEETRTNAAILLGVLAQSMERSVLEGLINSLMVSAQMTSLEVQHGAVCALGHVIGRFLWQCGNNAGSDLVVEDMEEEVKMDGGDDLSTCVLEPVKKLVSLLDDTNKTMMKGAACNALAEIGLRGVLPIPDENDDPPKDEEGVISKAELIKKLVLLVEDAKEHKLKEKAARCLGLIFVADPKHQKAVVEGLFTASKIRQVELQFTVGEALTAAAVGYQSSATQDPWSLDEMKPQSQKNSNEIFQWMIKEIILNYINSNIHFVRQAACVWLLSILKHAGKHPIIQSNLREIQQAFMSLLGETDDVTQEVSSRGLGLVYELGGEERKDELVSLLVGTLTKGKQSQRKVEGDTKVFEEGSLGKAPEGAGLTTYKELCSIASDLNKPDLIYKFMHLAQHNALWNSRKGAAFGFSSIAAQAKAQMEPHLPLLVPKLYRYQYDPNSKIQQAMSSIWSALVSDPKRTVDKYLNEIMEDLISNLTNTLWRVRQSSCLALSDLLTGQQLSNLVDYLPKLWELCLLVRDDIKESVRNAADIACKTLSKVSVRICDINQGKVGEKAIASVLPVVLKNGLSSRVEEIRTIGLATLLKMSKNAGNLLKPHIPVLSVALLESLSSLEPQVMNYLSLHLQKSQDGQEKLENIRLASSKTSPMMETVKLCVLYVDAEVLTELVPRLVELIRTGVGLSTKVGCADFVVSLCMQCNTELTPFAGKLLAALLSGLKDRSSSVRKAYARAIGHVVKVSKDSSVEKLFIKLRTWYLEKEDESIRESCGLTFQAMTRHCPDIVKAHASLVLPVAFLAMHESKEDPASGETMKNVWTEIWVDNTPGTEGGLRLYIEEITELVCPALTAQLWSTKAQAAEAVSTIAEKLGPALTQPHLGVLLQTLIKGLSGRTWAGKEKLLFAVSTICIKCRKSMEEAEDSLHPSISEILEVLIKECRRDNIVYKMAAIKCLGQILEVYSINKFQETSEILFPVVDPDYKATGADEDMEQEDEFEKSSSKKHDLKNVAFSCLGAAWPQHAPTQGMYSKQFCSILTKALGANTWKVQLTILRTLKLFTQRLAWKDESLGVDMRGLVVSMGPPLCVCLEMKKYSGIRLEALAVLDTLVTRLTENKALDLFTEESKKEIIQRLEILQQDSQPEIKDKASQLKRKIIELPTNSKDIS